MRNSYFKKSILLLASILIISILSISAFASMNVALSDQGSGVKTKSTGAALLTGNLTVLIYDALTSGTLVYNETYTNAIVNGSWNVMLGENGSNPLTLNFSKVYYKDYTINGEDTDFKNMTSGATVERQFFFSALGSVGSEDIQAGNFTFDTTTLVVDSTNNRVGIGTATPEYQLTVNGDFEAQDVYLNNMYTSDSGMIFYNDSDVALLNLSAGGSLGIGTTSQTSSKLAVAGNGNFTQTVYASNFSAFDPGAGLTFANGATNLMRIAGTGEVGIGIAMPPAGTKLTVSGSANFTQTVFANNISAQNPGAAIVFQDSNQDETVRITDGGDMGIGTNNPTTKLEVAGGIIASGSITTQDTSEGVLTNTISAPTGVPNITFKNSSGTEVMRLIDNGALNVTGTVFANNFSAMSASGNIIFQDSNQDEILRITDAGQVGIGKDPGMALDISGGILASGEITTTESSVGVTSPKISMPSDSNLSFQNGTASAIMMTLTQGGNLGIGTATPSHELTVEGDANVSSTLHIGGRFSIEGQSNNPQMNFTANDGLYIDMNSDGSNDMMFGLGLIHIYPTNGPARLNAHRYHAGSASNNMTFEDGGDNTHMSINMWQNSGDTVVTIGQSATNASFVVNGTMRLNPNTAPTCGSSTAGTIYFNSADTEFYGCTGTNWTKIS